VQLAAAHWDRLVVEEVQWELVECEGVQPFLDRITVADSEECGGSLFLLFLKNWSFRGIQMTQNFKITEEPPALPLVGTHILNAPLFERKFARVYFDTLKSHEVQIAKGVWKSSIGIWTTTSVNCGESYLAI
jgi:hypothetical protein